MAVLTRESPRESHSALAWSGSVMEITFARVKAPSAFVRPYQRIMARGMRIKPVIHMR